MNLLQQIQQICKQNNIIPSRSKGQNFLINENIYDQIVASADLDKDDIVLEVGPGLGILTAKLAKKAKKVVAVELDDKLAALLKVKIQNRNINNIEVINADVLDFRIMNHELRIMDKNKKQEDGAHDLLFMFNASKYKIVANLPYNITSIFLKKFLTAEAKPALMVLMLQKEVAKRIIAAPPEMSKLAVSVQLYSQPEIIGYVAKDNFWPRPEVDSAIVKIKIINRTNLSVDKEKDFWRLVKFGFSAKRKMLKNNLAAGYQITPELAENKLKLAGFDARIRAQELSVDDWLRLFGTFS